MTSSQSLIERLDNKARSDDQKNHPGDQSQNISTYQIHSPSPFRCFHLTRRHLTAPDQKKAAQVRSGRLRVVRLPEQLLFLHHYPTQPSKIPVRPIGEIRQLARPERPHDPTRRATTSATPLRESLCLKFCLIRLGPLAPIERFHKRLGEERADVSTNVDLDLRECQKYFAQRLDS